MNTLTLNNISLDGGNVIIKKGNNTDSSAGSGWTGHADAEGLRAIGWTDEDIAYYQAHGVNWNAEDDEYHKVTDDNKALYGVLTVDNIQDYKDRIVYLPKIDTSNKLNADRWFKSCYSLVSIPKLDTSKVTTMVSTFNGCYSLVSIPPLDTNQVIDMAHMFSACYSLTSIPQLDMYNVGRTDYMFNGCYSLKITPQLDTITVGNMTSMFELCHSLVSISQLDMRDMSKEDANIFLKCYSLSHAMLQYIKCGYQLKNSALLSKESILYMINNEAATSEITITLHSYAYSRFAEDTDIVEALNNHPLVSLASA